MRRLADALLVIAFALAICAPLVRRVVTGDVDHSVERELRPAAPEPELGAGWSALASFPERYEAWLADSFNFRGPLIRWHNALKLLVLGDAPTDELVVGEQGWLYATGDGALASWRALEPYTEAELAQWTRALVARRDWCAARDMQYRFLVAPNKHTVYPEYLPAELTRVHPRSRLDQLLDYTAAHSDFQVLDVRAELAAHKGAGLLYFQHGTHWNDRGAYLAYRKLVSSLTPAFPALIPHERAAFDVVEPRAYEPSWYGDTWATRLHIEDLLVQEAIVYQPRVARRAQIERFWMARRGVADGVMVHPDASLPTAVLLRDSFSDWLWPFLGEHFARLVTEADRGFDPAFLEDEAPDVVIEQLVERRLLEPPGLPGSEDQLALARAWLAGGPVVAGADVVARIEVACSAPGALFVDYLAATGGRERRRAPCRAGHGWVFVALGGVLDGELEVAGEGELALELLAIDVRAR